MSTVQSITIHPDGYVLFNGQKVECNVSDDMAYNFDSNVKLTGSTGVGRVLGAVGAKFKVDAIAIGAIEVVVQLSNGQQVSYDCDTERNFVKSDRRVAPDGKPQIVRALTARLSQDMILDW